MTEQEFRQSLRSSLTGADLPDCRRQQILRLTRGETIMKKRTGFRIALALLAILLLTTATALATGLFQGTVGWNGQPRGDTVSARTIPVPTATPAPEGLPAPTARPQPVNTIERLTEVSMLLNEEILRADGDLIIIAEEDIDPADTLTSRRFTGQRTVAVGSWEELQALVEGTALPLPGEVPEGYAVTELRVHYECRIGGAYTPVSSTAHTLAADGSTVTITRCAASPEHDVIAGYVIRLTNSTGDTLTIRAGLAADHSDMSFGLWDDETARSVSVPGMQQALLIEGSARSELHMRRTLPEPVAVISALHYDAPGDDRLLLLTDVIINVHATGLDGDALPSLFTE